MNFKNLSLILLTLTIFSCEPADEIEAKKNELAKAKEQLFELKSNIAQLEKDLIELGVEEIKTNLTLVSTITINKKTFSHQVDVRGEVQSKNNILISAETPAAVKDILVKEGQQVKKGALPKYKNKYYHVLKSKQFFQVLSLLQKLENSGFFLALKLSDIVHISYIRSI